MVELLQARFVVVVGYPMTGKTSLADRVKGFTVIHTDDYIGFGYENAVHVMLPEILGALHHGRVLVEGVQGVRLLNHLWDNPFKTLPDLVIYCIAHPAVRAARCIDRGKDPARTMAMDAGLLTQWRKWLEKYPDVPIHYHNT